MKNVIFIDIDTDRDQQILIGKPPEIKAPETREQAAEMISNDASSVFQALCTLILLADSNGYAKKNDLINVCIGELTNMIGEELKNPPETEVVSGENQ